MGKSMYVGVDGKARKAKKGFIGAGGLARKIKKGYIGVAGVSRPFWSGGAPVFYGFIPSLSVTGVKKVAAHLGNYAFFGFGARTDSGGGGSGTNLVDVYNKSLVRASAPTTYTYGFASGVATSNKKYAFFEAGDYNGTVSVFSETLVSSSVPLGYSPYYPGGTSVGEYAVIAGGRSGGDGTPYTPINFFDDALARTTASLSSGGECCGARTKNYAFILNASDSGFCNAFDANKVRSILGKLADNKNTQLGSGNLDGKYAIFGDGNRGGNLYTWDDSLVKKVVGGSFIGGGYCTIGSFEEGYCMAVLCDSGTELTIDTNLVVSTIRTRNPTLLSGVAAAYTGDYLVFGGGVLSYNASTSAEPGAYTNGAYAYALM